MGILFSIFIFIIVVSIIVFVHEFGHYIIAKICGVKILEFSIGFGPILYKISDKHGTIWKICAIPAGGYVKMYGDDNAASVPDFENEQNLDKSKTFQHKNVLQRIAIVFAGPLFNYLFAIILLTLIYSTFGYKESSNIIKDVVVNSPAAQAGIVAGDEIISVNNKKTANFQDIMQVIMLHQANPIDIIYKRSGLEGQVNIVPQETYIKDENDKESKIFRIGIVASEPIEMKLSLWSAYLKSVDVAYNVSSMTLSAIGQMIIGDRDTKDLGGPIKIAQYSSKSFAMGFLPFIWFIAMLSINLGLINLLPIPLLDGGHLLFYFIELIIGRPVPKKIQQFCFRIGLILLMMIFIFSVVNDIISMSVL
jgi:regulator of sigma E protease